ncbi:hypothetical protein KR026_012428 [Drosophila bipectinata]|nr:hypothetical protein KR026_012428 [Drosophila bipectinata]
MYSKYSFNYTVIAVLLFAVAIQSAPSDVVVEKAEDPVPAAVQPAEEPKQDFVVPEDCHQPKETGRCFALFYRFAYNVDTKACEEFVYGGCAGNKNNFESKEQCEEACLGRSGAKPQQPSDTTTEPSADVTTETSTSA